LKPSWRFALISSIKTEQSAEFDRLPVMSIDEQKFVERYPVRPGNSGHLLRRAEDDDPNHKEPLSGVQNCAVWSPVSPSSGRENRRNARVRSWPRGLKAPEETAMCHGVDSGPLAQAVTVAGRPAVRL
jgi:hypothetical protein